MPTRLTTVEAVHEAGSYLFTATDPRNDAAEITVVPYDEGDNGEDGDDGGDGGVGGDGGDGEDGEDGEDGDDGVAAWITTCTHEAQRLDRGGDVGAVTRDGQLVCPKHGSLFDTCEGSCDNGPAAGSPLVAVDIAVNRRGVYLTAEDYEFEHEGGVDDGDGIPDSTSHLRL
ncbi:MAG: Rieske 2Fe-2S domain-containing protein [Haloarculaceae archaeon]